MLLPKLLHGVFFEESKHADTTPQQGVVFAQPDTRTSSQVRELLFEHSNLGQGVGLFLALVLHHLFRRAVHKLLVGEFAPNAAQKALRIFEARKIDDLIVIDGDGRPVGVIDGQDLTKARIV